MNASIFKGAAIVLVMLFLFKAAVLIWSLDKGFDLTDEATFLLGAKFSESYHYVFHYSHIILRKIFFFVQPDIFNYRLLKIFAEVLSLLVFTFGFYRWSTSESSVLGTAKVSFAFLFFFGALGTFLSLFSRAISYNDITNFNILASFGLMLYLLSFPAEELKKPARRMVLTLIGALIGIQFFVKFSSSVIQIFLLAVLMLAHGKGYWSGKLKALALVPGGMIIAFLFFFLLYGKGVRAWLHDYLRGFDAISLLGYNNLDFFIWLYLKVDFTNFLRFFTPAAAIFTVAFFISRYFFAYRAAENNDRHIACVTLFGILIFALTLYYFDFMVYDDLVLRTMHFSALLSVYFYPFMIYALLFAAAPSFWKSSADRKSTLKNFTVMGATVILPYIIMAGTDTSLVKGIYAHLIPWFVLMAALASYLLRRLNYRWSFAVVVLAITAASQYHFIDGYIFRSYRVLGGLTNQNYGIVENSTDRISFDEQTYQFLKEIQTVLVRNGFKKNDPVIALTEMSGAVYFVDGFSPGTPCYFPGSRSVAFNCFHLKENLGELSRPPFLLLNQRAEMRNLQCLSEAGIGFPDDYVPVGEVWNPIAQSMTLILAYKPALAS